MGDFAAFVGDEPGNQPDAQLQYKRFGRIDHINGVKDISDSHAERASDTSIESAQYQSAQNADRVSQVDGCGVPSGQRYFDLQEGEYHIGQCCEYAGHYQFLDFFISHFSFLLIKSFYI